MKRTSFSRWPCSVARTVGLLGDAWTPLVLREAFYGIRRFDQFQATLGIARNTLTRRLATLTEEGLLRKVPYSQEPVRHEYVLTEKGRDFFPVIAAMATWGDRWLAGDAGRPVTFHHTTCDHDTTATVVCNACHQPLTADTVAHRMGPGYPAKLAALPDVQARFGVVDS